jgi:hypothetical protein
MVSNALRCVVASVKRRCVRNMSPPIPVMCRGNYRRRGVDPSRRQISPIADFFFQPPHRLLQKRYRVFFALRKICTEVLGMVRVVDAARTHPYPVGRRIDGSPIKYCGPTVAVIFNRTVPEHSRETFLYRGLERFDIGSPALLNGIGIERFEISDPPVKAGNPDLHLFDC